jgi:hypothetical protein
MPKLALLRSSRFMAQSKLMSLRVGMVGDSAG